MPRLMAGANSRPCRCDFHFRHFKARKIFCKRHVGTLNGLSRLLQEGDEQGQDEDNIFDVFENVFSRMFVTKNGTEKDVLRVHLRFCRMIC